MLVRPTPSACTICFSRARAAPNSASTISSRVTNMSSNHQGRAAPWRAILRVKAVPGAVTAHHQLTASLGQEYLFTTRLGGVPGGDRVLAPLEATPGENGRGGARWTGNAALGALGSRGEVDDAGVGLGERDELGGGHGRGQPRERPLDQAQMQRADD